MVRATGKKAAKRKTARKSAPAPKESAAAATGGRRKKTTSAGRKSTAKKKTAAKRTAARKNTRRYGIKASAEVGQELHELERGQLRSGGSGKKVTERKQAIAIGLSKARRSGAKVPPKPRAREKSK